MHLRCSHMKFTFIDASWRLALSRESSLRAKVSPHHQWNPLDSRRIRFGTSGTTALVHVSTYKYVNKLWFFLVFLQGCESHIFSFIQAELPRNIRSRWHDWSERKYRKGEGTSLPVLQASVSQIILIVAPPIQHFHEICERWSCESESNALCQIQATLFWWSNLVKGKEAFDESYRGTSGQTLANK